MTGLAVGSELVKLGHDVELFERSRPGGLAGGFLYRGSPGVYLDKFYHHVFTSDRDVLELIGEHGLEDELIWRPAASGLIAGGRTWPFGSPMDLLRFRPLGNLWQRLLMGWNLLAFQKTSDWRRFDEITCREFFARRWNLAGYRNLWEPLLKQKFADAFDDIPASFLWGRINPRARSRSRRRESLGYLRFGFQRLVLKMVEALARAGAPVHTGKRVTEIRPGRRPRLTCDGRSSVFDRVVWTAALEPLVRTIVDPPAEAVRRARSIEYVAATQMILILRRRQSDFYWLNNLDPQITFGGLVEHTNLVPAEDYGGEHVLYVINYHRPGDRRFTRVAARTLLDYHLPSLEKVLPEFRVDDVIRVHCVREAYSSPLYDMGFAARMPPYADFLPGVDVCGMFQVYPEDRNMSHCVANARRYVRRRFTEGSAKAPPEEVCAEALRPAPVLCQPWFDELGAMGGLPVLADSGAGKLPLAPVSSALTKH